MQNCKCNPCRYAPYSKYNGCCSGHFCGYSGGGRHNMVCLPFSWYFPKTHMRGAAATQPVRARSSVAGGQSVTELSVAGQTFTQECSSSGQSCNLDDSGRQCCPKANLDCVMVSTGAAQCVSRTQCKRKGHDCSGIGQCCGGLVCASNNECREAVCTAATACKAGDATCQARRQMECDIERLAAMGSPSRQQAPPTEDHLSG